MRARRALNDTGVYGVKTTIPYYLEVLDVADFQAGKFDTSFVEDASGTGALQDQPPDARSGDRDRAPRWRPIAGH